MNSISLDELAGYREDAEGLRDFQRPYLIPSVLSMGVAVAAFVLMISAMQASHLYRGQTPDLLQRIWLHAESAARRAGLPMPIPSYVPMLLFFGAVLSFSTTMFIMAHATPVSRMTGEKLEKYWNADALPGDREIVYVDRAARTYFRRVFATTSGPHTPSAPLS